MLRPQVETGAWSEIAGSMPMGSTGVGLLVVHRGQAELLEVVDASAC